MMWSVIDKAYGTLIGYIESDTEPEVPDVMPDGTRLIDRNRYYIIDYMDTPLWMIDSYDHIQAIKAKFKSKR